MRILRVAAAAALALGLSGVASAQQFQQDDLVVGVNSNTTDSFRQIRNNVGNLTAATAPDSGTLVSGGVSGASPWSQAFIQSVEFDNANGISHNAEGNLLGANFGGGFTGFEIYNFATDGTGNFESLWGISGETGGSRTDRGGGLSVNPANNLIAWGNFDGSTINVHPYDAGSSVGAGSGASITGWIETAGGNTAGGPGVVPALSGGTTGTTWLDDDTVVAVSTSGNIVRWDIPAATIAAATDTTTPETDSSWSFVGSLPFTSGQYIDIEYQPLIDPDHIVVSRGQFSGGSTTNEIFVIDANTFALVDSIDISSSTTDPGSSATLREIAYDSDGNLFIGGFGENVASFIPDFAANIGSLSNNSSVFWFNNDFFSSFSGLDVAASLSAAPPLVPGDTDGDGDVDLADLDTLASNFGGTPPLAGGASIGDFDGDGDVDLADLDTLASNFGFGTSTAVPEPTAAVLALLAACGLAARRR